MNFFYRLRSQFHKQELDKDLSEELAFHIAQETEENIAAGMSAGEAHYAALRKLGGIDQVKEECRDAWGLRFIDTLIQDIRFGLRMLAKNPGFTAVAVLTLALGIGANSVIFSVINGLFLHPAGIADPARVFAIRVRYQKLNLPSIVVSAPGFADVRDSRQVFSSTAASDQEGFNYLGPDGPERLMAAKVTWEWFNVFGVRPLMGRVFRPEEDQPKANQVVVLAYRAWQRQFGSDLAIVGKSIRLNEQDYRVVGVMGPEFEWPRRADLWMPLGLAPSEFSPDNYFNENFFVVARARTDVAPRQAEAFLQVLTRRLIAAYPQNTYARDSGWGMLAVPFTEYGSGHLRSPMLILLGAVGFVLLIACSNIGGLVLARASARTREFAVRVALGAQRRDLLRQALTESFVLTAGGALLGIAGAYGGLGTLLKLVPGRLPARPFIGIDGHVLLFAVAVSLLAGIFLGVVPMGHVLGREQFGALQAESRTVTAGQHRQRLRELLVAGQVALALVLLIGAGLFLKSLTRLVRIDPGFDPTGVMTATVQLPEDRYNADEKLAAFYRGVEEKLAALPGVSSAAIAAPLPFSGFAPSSSFTIEGRVNGRGDPGPHSDISWITPDYFQALRIPLLRGRYFTGQDRTGAPPVVVIDENLARQYWPHRDPIGRHVRRGGHDPWSTVVGVVAHVMLSALVGDSGKGVCYYPLMQQPISHAFLIVRTRTDPAQMGNSMRAAVASVDPGQPVASLETMEQYVAGSLDPQRIVVSLLAIFSVLALFLAALGLYGVMSYNVAQRTHEIGIRVALGAGRGQVWRLVLAQGMRAALAGIVVGALGAAVLVRSLTSQLFSVSAYDPMTFLVAGLILLAAALVACLVPALRATKVDPMVALRHE